MQACPVNAYGIDLTADTDDGQKVGIQVKTGDVSKKSIHTFIERINEQDYSFGMLITASGKVLTSAKQYIKEHAKKDVFIEHLDDLHRQCIRPQNQPDPIKPLR